MANMISSGYPENTIGKARAIIVFSDEDALDVNPHDNDPLVIIIQHENWDIRRALNGLGS